MIAAEPAAIGDSRGWIAGDIPETRASADWVARALRPPPPALRSWKGPLATAAAADLWSQDYESQLVLAKVALVVLHASAVGPGLSFRRHAVTRQSRKSRMKRPGWLARAVFVFGPTF